MYAVKGDHIHIADAQALEQKEDFSGAASLYEALLKQSPKNLRILQRLMVLFRKLRNVKKELQYIDTAIKVQQQKYVINGELDKRAATISNQLNKMLGHTDKKGKTVFVADEILKLELRKARLLSKKPKDRKKKP
ncbi:MAG: hypothetical protein EOO13_11730 [Chitinophagaceae bacterium]|nr:MAG: hypothetical protein EOO13_11730 [Chitinophagaceae bacterium]